MQYDRISRESTAMNWLVPQIMDEIRNKQTIVTTVMGCGWVRQSGRRVEQKVCRGDDNEMSDNGASTLPQLKISPIEIWCFHIYRSIKMCVGMGEGVSLLRKTVGGRG